MKTEIKKLPDSQIEIFFEISAEEFKDYFSKAIENLGKEIEIEGFRKGKAPKEILESKLDQGKILQEAASLAINENYTKAVLENKIEAISNPKIEILKVAKGSPFEFRAKIFILPEVKLPDYKEIASKVKPKEVFVEDKEIEKAINWLQKSRAKLSPKDGPAARGDFVEIDFSSLQIENGKNYKDSFILGEGHFVPGFEEKLEGMQKDEEKEFSLKFPDDYLKKELAGKEAVFKVRMVSIQKIELPEITDDWAKSLGNFVSLAALRESIKEGIKIEKENEESIRVSQEILEKISENSKIEIPMYLIEMEKNRIMNNLKHRVSETLKISFNDYLVKIQKKEEELLESFKAEAEKNIKNFLILKEIAKIEKIDASNEEIENEINKIIKNYDIDQVKKLDLEKLKIYIEDEIKKEKTLKFLKNLIKI